VSFNSLSDSSTLDPTSEGDYLDLKTQLKEVFAVLGADRVWGQFDPRKKE
jgi:hypothetical protein